ncbi:MAG: DoxX family protein [Bacteroidales bacterium]|nr:DoxX family protein [Bacteroidales bacterium]
MKVVRFICRILLGLVFIFSGFVKGIDPMGSAIKFGEYFSAFHLSFLGNFSLLFSVLLASAEFIIGIALLLGLRMKIASWAVFLFMSFFTLLTLILALTNPVSDCGCFGDAIKLTNWQTFLKNVILMVPVMVVFLERNKFSVRYKPLGEWVTLGILFTGILLVIRYCYFYLPIMDFLPYRTGTNIPKAMEIPEGAPQDEYKTILYYQKDGVTKEFTLENYPWQDSTWKWVDTKTVLIKKGYQPPIHDFRFTDQEGNDITDLVLYDTRYVFLLISPNVQKANTAGIMQAKSLADLCHGGNCAFYALTASPFSEIRNFTEKNNPGFPFYHADETTLQTMIRSNPGLMLIKDGTIIAKWSYREFPEVERLKNDILGYAVTYYREKRESLTKTILILTLLLTLAVIKILQLNFDRRD